MNLDWRPLTLSDANAAVELLAAAEKADPTGEHHSAEDFLEEISSPNLDLARGTISAWDGERLVAYAEARFRDAAEPVHQMRVSASVHPDHRSPELGAEIVRWFLRAGRDLHERTFPAAALALHGHSHESQHWYADVLTAGGFTRARTFLDMRADLDALPPSEDLPHLPGELRLVPFTTEYDEATRLARNATFAEHWGSTDQSPAAWRHLVTGSGSFQPELSFLVLGQGDVVMAFVLSAFFEADFRATGVRELYVSNVGTRQEWRGQGVATVLLAHTITEARARGFHRASLGVDVDNVNRALGVYERCGFSEFQRWFGWVLAVRSRT